MNFERCNKLLFKARFENCRLDFSSFFELPMNETLFKNCSLKEADFTQADLTGSVFDYCNMDRTVFQQTIIEKADFRTSFNFIIDPEINRLRQAKFSDYNLRGLLEKYNLDIESS